MLTMARRFLIALTTLQLLGGCAFLYRYDDISEKPVRAGAEEPLKARTSTLQPALTIPLASLQEAANNAAGAVLPKRDGGNARIGGIEVEWPWGGCILCAYLDVNWNYTISQPAPIRIEGGSDLLSVVLPAAVAGKAGFGGDLAKIFSLHEKNFGAAAEIDFRGGLATDRRFCPSIRSPDLRVRWTTDPYIQIVGQNCIGGACVGPWNLNLRDPVDHQLGQSVPVVMSQLQTALPCEPVRRALGQIWRNYSIPVTLPYERMFLNITPTAMHFPGLGVNSTHIAFLGRLDATVGLDTTPGPTTPLPLPQNDPLPITPGRFSIAVPVSTRYYTFEALIKQALVGQKFQATEPLGGVIVTPQAVEVFPANDGKNLAIGVAVAVEFRYLFFLNTSGTVWFTATPTATDGGRKLRVSDVRVTREFTNPVWEWASALLHDKVANSVRDGFELDLNPPLEQAESQLKMLLEQAGQSSGVSLDVTDVKLQLGRMHANERTFQLEAILDAVVKANLGEAVTP